LAEWETCKEDEEEEEKEVYLMEEQEEVVEEADEGELIILRRALSSQKGDLEEQRENIFHTRCTIQGKVCSHHQWGKLCKCCLLKHSGEDRPSSFGPSPSP